MKRRHLPTFPLCVGVAMLVHGGIFWASGAFFSSGYLPVRPGPSSVDLILYAARPAKIVVRDEPLMAVKEFTERQEERRPDALTEVREESAEPVVASEGVLTAAEPLDFVNASPKYPYIARKRGWEGTVEIEAVISPKGDAQVVRVYRSSGFAVLDEEALKTVRSWRFHSARRGPVAVQSTIIIPVHFQLTGDQNNDDSGF